MNNQMVNAQELCLMVNITYQTLNNWYRFKRNEPDNELAKLLPDPIQTGSRSLRLWNRNDVWKLIEFKSAIPKGRNGIMGATTQKYYKK